MEYLQFNIQCREEFKDIIIAELAEVGFDSFLETETGMSASIIDNLFVKRDFDRIINKYRMEAQITYDESLVQKINWNEEWEKHYDPIEVGEEILVRASFHAPKKNMPYEIIINPKMSFGTGHHATTYLMLSLQLNISHQGKRIIDIGSGTGILAIMAKILGAQEVVALDIDEWCVENGNENFLLNGMDSIRMILGSIREITPPGTFDIALANINKNVLLDEMETYYGMVKPGGYLLLSGFYEQDIPDIVQHAQKLGFKLHTQKIRNNWAALVLGK
jgi:ribosomal protein L11 methyltransferase